MSLHPGRAEGRPHMPAHYGIQPVLPSKSRSDVNPKAGCSSLQLKLLIT